MNALSKLMPLLFELVFLGIGIFLLGTGIASALKASRAAAWPTTPAVLQSVELEQQSDSDGASYNAAVRYSYQVNGVSHSGDTLSFGYEATSGRRAHQEIVDKLKSAKTVEVRYNPNDASESCISYGLSRSHQIHLAFAVTWLVFVLGFIGTWHLFEQSDTRLLNRIVVLEERP